MGGKEQGGTWCCESCQIIHRSDVAGMVLDALMKGEAVGTVWKKLEAHL
jgi:Zn-finger protein